MKLSEFADLKRRLKPCPFCMSKAELQPMLGTSSWWRVRCAEYTCGGTTWAMDEPSLAVATWNRRSDDAQ